MSIVSFANSFVSGVPVSAFDFIQIGSYNIRPNQPEVFVTAAVQSIEAFDVGANVSIRFFAPETLGVEVPTTPLTIQGPFIDGPLVTIRFTGGTFSANFTHLGGV